MLNQPTPWWHKPLTAAGVGVGVGLAAAGPVLLHGHVERDCSPFIEVCPASFLFSAPDEPSPLLISAMEMAAFTGSTVSTSSALIVAPYSPVNWVK
jgi:hypothetical protein